MVCPIIMSPPAGDCNGLEDPCNGPEVSAGADCIKSLTTWIVWHIHILHIEDRPTLLSAKLS